MELITQLATYFLIYSFFGWIIESIYKSILEKKFINSGFLFGPICPIYGFGAIIMFLFLNSFSNKPYLVFIIGIIVLTFWEYMVGLILEKIFQFLTSDKILDTINMYSLIIINFLFI